MQFQSRMSTATVALLCASGAAFSANVGTSPSAGAVINPITGQETQVWKLVGHSSGCTTTQLTREWILSTNHCGASNSVGGTPAGDYGFYNYLGHSAVNTASCEPTPSGRDFNICRLSNPAAMTALSSYPPLVSGTGSIFTRLNANKLGTLLTYGRATPPDVLNFVSFDSLPYGFDPAVNPSGSQIPVSISGDSGGAAYWFSPTSTQFALAGVIGGGQIAILSGIDFFTADEAAWIVNKISGAGDVPPTVITAAQHFTGSAANTASELSSPPTFQGTGYNWTVNWQTPSPEPVTSYTVTVGKNGVLERSVSVAASTGNSTTLNALSADNYRICVRPVNSVGPAPAVQSISFAPDQPWHTTGIVTPNCAGLDLRTPTDVGTLSFSSTYSAATGLYKITATWATPSAPTQISKYQISQKLTYASGPVRNSTTTTTGPTYSATNLPVGSKVCLTVTAYNALTSLPGTTSSTQCFTAN